MKARFEVDSSLRGRVAIVTGGASGIGAALVRALAARGAVVIIADVDEAGAKAVAEQVDAGTSAAVSGAGSGPVSTVRSDPVSARGTGPGSATGTGLVSTAALDVRDAQGVADLVRRTAAEHGRLDLMFNNAGIAVGGMVEELLLDHWDRVIDVNLRGVVHGVHAAYPLMLGQGFGHIVNTASLAGLVPGPMLAPYAAAKHGVVGLSLALRAEAAGRGVRVSVICPGFVDTPLLGRVNPDLPQTETGSNAVALARLTGRLYNADALAQDVLRGIARNRAVIVAPASARLAWRMTRYAPGLSMRTLTAAIRRG
jgi:NAD(P)-dependent dehydrogenase (short-subunit alcohol dehydrogenase family)